MPKKKQSRRDLDSPWKETLQHFLEAVLQFFFPELHASIDWSKGYVALDKEFQQIIAKAKSGRSLADKLFKVWWRNGKEVWLLVHVEVQGQVERLFARRMFRYNVRCFELYDRRVLSVALLCDDNKNWRPRGFSYGACGSRTGIRFPTAKLIDYVGQEEALGQEKNPAAHVVLAFLNARTTKSDPKSRLASKIRLVKGLYDRGWSANDVRQLFRLIDWLMELPRELQGSFRQDLHEFEEERKMPYVTSVERLAMEEGAKSELLSVLTKGLKSRFGADALGLMDDIRRIQDLEQLRAITDLLWTCETIQDIRNLLVT